MSSEWGRALINRRKVLRDAAILLATGAAAACAAPRATVATAASGSIAWEHRADGAVRGLRYGQDGVVVETDAVLTGLDLQGGRELWRLPIATTGIGHGSCLWIGALVVCETEPDTGGQRAVALDLATGQRKWSFDAPEGNVLEGAFGVRDWVLYLIASGHGKSTREVWAVDMRTKTVRWRSPSETEELYVPDTGSLIYTRSPGAGGDIAALDLATGATVWSRAGDPGVYATAVGSGLVGGAVLVSDGVHTVSGLDPKTGAALWSTPALSYPTDTVFGSGDAYYLCDGAKLHAMNPDGSASPLWSLTLAASGTAVRAGGYAAGATFYLLAARTLRAIDAHSSKVRWMQSIPDGDGSAVPFAIGETHCYVQSGDGTGVVALMR